MSRKYTVAFRDTAETKTHTADDVQIKPDSIKFLNGKGASATVVAYYPIHRVASLEEVQ